MIMNVLSTISLERKQVCIYAKCAIFVFSLFAMAAMTAVHFIGSATLPVF